MELNLGPPGASKILNQPKKYILGHKIESRDKFRVRVRGRI